MGKRKFDFTTRSLFTDIQNQITQIEGKLLNPKVTNREELEKEKLKLRNKSKELKQRYYAESAKRILKESSALLARIENYSVENISKV